MSAVLGHPPFKVMVGFAPAERVRTRGLLTWAKDLRQTSGLTIANDLSYNVLQFVKNVTILSCAGQSPQFIEFQPI
jgi:hypothetical protein